MSLNKEEFAQKVKKLLAWKSGLEETEFTLESRLTEDLDLDSLDRAELMLDFMQEFNIDIPYNNQPITTLDQAIEYLYPIYSKKHNI